MIKNYLRYAVAAALFGIGNVALAETEVEAAGTAGTNDSFATAQSLVFTDRVEVTGTIGRLAEKSLQPISDIDFYWFQGRKGEVVRIDIDGGMKDRADPLRSLDSLIAIFDQNGIVLKQKNDLNVLAGETVDEGSRSSFDPWIEKIFLPASGRYYVGVTSDASFSAPPGAPRPMRVFVDGGTTAGPEGTDGFVGGSVSNGRYTLVIERTPAPTIQIGIDIKPNARSITTHANSHGKIPVVLKTSEEFDALKADQHTIKFGPPNRPGTVGRCNKNGNDLLCHFDKQDAGFTEGDTEGVVSGTIDGKPFEGSAWLKVIPVTREKKD